MKKLLYTFVLMVLCLSLMTVSASAMVQYNSYNNGMPGCHGYNMVPNGGGYGYGMVPMPPQPQGPGLTTEFHTKWIPGHWIQVRIMMPGRWINRYVWVHSYPVTQTRWVAGFWQTTGMNMRPDLQIWGSPQTGWFGKPFQNQNPGGYFTPRGMWIPAQ